MAKTQEFPANFQDPGRHGYYHEHDILKFGCRDPGKKEAGAATSKEDAMISDDRKEDSSERLLLSVLLTHKHLDSTFNIYCRRAEDRNANRTASDERLEKPADDTETPGNEGVLMIDCAAHCVFHSVPGRAVLPHTIKQSCLKRKPCMKLARNV